MPRRNDVKKVMIIGSGPIIIGQACEFDYSGTQACKALRKLGYQIVLANSNPATIMTDPGMADITYIEPLTLEAMTEIIKKERPDGLLPNLGGQSGLNLVSELSKAGVLEKYGVKVIGVNVDAIERGEDRIAFKNTMNKLGIDMPKSDPAYTVEEAEKVAEKLGYPVVIRPAYTMGGTGGGLVYNIEELRVIASRGISASLVGQILIEESVLGWEELELEVVRDAKNQMITVCFIENVDAMGVHTGDSYCTAPMLTIDPKLQKKLQKYSYDIVEAIQVIGGTNIQFAHDPKTGRVVVIEINPRTSRSSALASKATGFPIALVSAMLAGGLTLDEIPYWRDGTLEKYTPDFNKKSLPELMDMLSEPTSERQFIMYEALRKGADIDELFKKTYIKTHFLKQMKELVELEEQILKYKGKQLPDKLLTQAKKDGFADKYLAQILGVKEEQIRKQRTALGVVEGWHAVPVSGVENAAYYYSSYNAPDTVGVSDKKKIMVLGGGPNRIGQGIEFDYCCVHAAFALRDLGYETIMVNCNPETVSTDYDTSDKLYFEPLTVEDVLSIYQKEKPVGVICQFGGQTPLNLAAELERAGVRIIGTSVESIDLAEDRDRFRKKMESLGIPMPASGMASTFEEAAKVAAKIGYPLMVRPSYVLGGRGMEVVYDVEMLKRYVDAAVGVTPERPILIDKFLENALECEADALADGTDAFVPAVMEHIELAGIHSGDSACVIPPISIPQKHLDTIYEYTRKIAIKLNVVGLMNMQYAIAEDKVYVLEANPRASRTVPLVSKVCGIQMARLATQLMLGKKIVELKLKPKKFPHFGVKESVFPFNMFPEVDPILGPEMRSTGEVLGMADSFGLAFYKAEDAAKQTLPSKGTVLITVNNADKDAVVDVAKRFVKLGFKILATNSTCKHLKNNGVKVESIYKMQEGRPNIMDAIKNGEIQLLINTPAGKTSQYDDSYIRKAAIKHKIPYITTIAAATASAKGIEAVQKGKGKIKSLQEYHAEIE
ncbi:MAG: carbamoyl-phosphate synthase large subunit [Phycisphaerae bacterium]|nr:carbamoyl-phosphate synthase large subunit [Phycisphaerae bacterium]